MSGDTIFCNLGMGREGGWGTLVAIELVRTETLKDLYMYILHYLL
jgi:hypothetical protein